MLSQTQFIAIGRKRFVSNQRNDGGEFLNADLPDVEIGDSGVAIALDGLLYLHIKIGGFRMLIQQDRVGVAHEGVGPLENHGAADEAHRRIQPCPSKEFAADKSEDSQQRSQRVSNDVDVGGSQVQIMVVGMWMTVVVFMTASMAMLMARFVVVTGVLMIVSK